MTSAGPFASAAQALEQLERLGDPARAALARRYFRTGPGDYGAGDLFLGLRVPQVRLLARRCRALSLEAVTELLRSPWHEARLLALIVLVERHRKGDTALRQGIFDLYLASAARVNNWDLVDTSAPQIVGEQLLAGDAGVLDRLAASGLLWERRIAVLASFAFIRAGRPEVTLRIAETLLGDRHDLIHKAVGWALRELGKGDRALEERFLAAHYARMPRTMLRYAIEKLPPERRQAYLLGRI